jgi:hypothetical protein
MAGVRTYRGQVLPVPLRVHGQLGWRRLNLQELGGTLQVRIYVL